MDISRLARIGLLGALATGIGAAPVAATGGGAADSAPARGNIVGVVHDENGQGVGDIAVEVLDGDGKVVQRATSSRAGGYEIRCVDEGTYDLRLDPAKSGHRGQRVVAPVTGDGLTVDCTVAADKPAIARARANGGACASAAGEAPGAPAGTGAEGAGAAAGLGAGALAVSGTIGGLSASGAFDSDKSGTPSQ